MIGRALERWVAFQVLGKVERKPPQRADTSRGPARDWRYRAWIRTLPCAACGRTRKIEASHTGPHGLNQKASDYRCVPLCIEHHRTGKAALDRIGGERFERVFQIDLSGLVRRLNRIWFESRTLSC
jgi:hypothetical protein